MPRRSRRVQRTENKGEGSFNRLSLVLLCGLCALRVLGVPLSALVFDDFRQAAGLRGVAMAGGGGMSAAMLPGLMDPTARPDEPVTAGADAGAGIGMQAAGIGTDFQITNEQLRPLLRSLEPKARMTLSEPRSRETGLGTKDLAVSYFLRRRSTRAT